MTKLPSQTFIKLFNRSNTSIIDLNPHPLFPPPLPPPPPPPPPVFFLPPKPFSVLGLFISFFHRMENSQSLGSECIALFGDHLFSPTYLEKRYRIGKSYRSCVCRKLRIYVDSSLSSQLNVISIYTKSDMKRLIPAFFASHFHLDINCIYITGRDALRLIVKDD